MNIQAVTDDIRSLMDLFHVLSVDGSLSFDGELKLFRLFVSIKNTNSIIRVAQMTLKDDADKLYNEAQILAETANTALDAYNKVANKLLSINFMADCEAHLKPFEEELGEKRRVASALWREYTSKSNRLDFLDVDSDEYKALNAECDAAKATYEAFHAKLSKLNDDFDKKQREIGAISFFNPSLFSVVLRQIDQIAVSIISDIKDEEEQKGKEGYR